MEALKRCPFCGSMAAVEQSAGRSGYFAFYSVRCGSCGCGTKEYPTAKMATVDWERRVKDLAPDPSLIEDKREVVDRLKKLLLVTRAGQDIEEMYLMNDQEHVVVKWRDGYPVTVNIAADSGLAIIQDVIRQALV